MPMPFATSHNLNLTALCKEARLKAALHSLLTTHNPTVNASTYLQLLQARISKKFLSEGVKPITTTFGSVLTACAKMEALEQGCLQNGVVEKALETFKQMQLGGVKPNSTTFASILPACARMGALDQGYAQNGLVEKALEAFTQMQLAGYAQNGFFMQV
ncbi:hypothetical protein SUGI_0488660 [Cryptomeria japonica]|nr:hypothetical protein SUGI_0488660 [Cryptomeria japonica]